MPSILTCRACLEINAPLYDASETAIQEIFENVTKISLKIDQLPTYLCVECLHLLRRCDNFRRKCLRTHAELMKIIHSDVELCEESIKVIDRQSLNLDRKLSIFNGHSVNITPLNDIHEVKEEFIKKELVEINVEACKLDDPGIYDHLSDFDDDDDDVPLSKMASDDITAVKVKSKPTKKGFAEPYAKEILLTKEQQITEAEGRRNSQNYLHSPYRCVLCYRGFLEESAYKNHCARHDEKRGQYACDVCHFRYPTRRQLRSHTDSAHRRRYECNECKHMSQTANLAREHERWHRGHKYECKQCGLTFEKPSSHFTHIRKAHKSLFACVECGESCVSAHGLRMHLAKTPHVGLERLHEPESERYCNECDVQFLSKDAWRRHMLTAVCHKIQLNTEKNCVICKAEFATNTELKMHVREHRKEIKPSNKITKALVKFHCDLCSTTFVNKSKLQVHYRHVHLGLKPFVDFVCEVCGKHFKAHSRLKYHHRTHTGERPYPCLECPKRFVDSNQLRIHQRRHSGLRPYACQVCARTFRQKPALNRHMRVHTGDKPYACTLCPKAFSQSNSLKLHTRSVHHKLPCAKKRGKPPPPAPS